MKQLYAAAVFIAALGVAGPARAAIPIVEGEEGYLELGGYAQTVTGVQYTTFDTQGLIPDTSGVGSQVLRLEWDGQFSRDVTFKVHNRLFGQVSSAGQGLGAGQVVGLGASSRPDRSLDLSTSIVDEQGVMVDHDIDRAQLSIFTESADITLGRQAITWGRGTLFPVADLWTQFSPFELDQTQKRGIDAARVLTYPGAWEVDLVVADKGALEDLSGGVRAARTIDWADIYVASAKIWEELFVMGGVTVTSGYWRGRAEIAAPYDLDDGDLLLPRATVGGDYIAGDMQLSVEYHFNGAGADSPAGYLEQLQSEVFARGESYYLGRHYAGAAFSYSGFERTTLALSAIGNLQDPSVILAPTFRYIISDDADIAAGAFQGFGEDPSLLPAPELNSEYGLYGGFVFTQLRAFF